MPESRSFPDGFVWGVATSSYQIEGAVDADGRGPSIWDTFSHTPGRTDNGDTGEVADDHYHRYAEDVSLMASMGVAAYRFSVAWPRIVPTGSGAVNQAGLDFYSRLVDALLGAGVEPWLTLYHWDLPQPLQDAGGWTVRDTSERFAEYAGAVAAHLGDRVHHWSTLNEPWCSSLLSYAAGVHAPGEQDPAHASAAIHHLLLGHGLAARALRAAGVDDLGITLNLAPIAPQTGSPTDADAARRVDGQQNRVFLDPVLVGSYPADVSDHLARSGAPLPVRDGDLDVIHAPLDWLGVNYYTGQRVTGASDGPGESPESTPGSPFIGCADVTFVPPGERRTAMGWGVEPDGFRELLVRLHTDYPGVPLYVTENGAAYDDVVADDGAVHDDDRVGYFSEHLGAALDAVEAGADLRGYFAWSLLDNFEWAEGYSKRFGLVRVDYDSQQRTVKDSGHWYGRVARSGLLPPT